MKRLVIEMIVHWIISAVYSVEALGLLEGSAKSLKDPQFSIPIGLA